MHSYIDITKLRDFSQEVTDDSVWQDLIDYGITNISDDEGQSLWLIAKTLNEDYQMHRANYKSYIERGMNLRMLMELHKSAILPVAEQDYWFYTNHKNAETVQDVKQLRIDFLGRLNSDYHDEDWQYMAIIKGNTAYITTKQTKYEKALSRKPSAYRNVQFNVHRAH